MPLSVVKRDGTKVPFDRQKIVNGVIAACKGRPVTLEQIDALVDAVEEEVRTAPGEVPTSQVGMAVLEQLKDLDEVSYMRFASVYKNFDEAADFRRELALLKKNQ